MKAGWIEVALGDVASVDRQVVEPSQIRAGVFCVGLENMVAGGGLRDVTPVAAGQIASAKFAFDTRHVLFGKLRPNLAKSARPDFVGVCSTDILPIRPGPRLDRDYLAHFIARPATVALATQRCDGANLPRLSPKELQRFRLPLPPLDEQRRIAEMLNRADALRAKRRVAVSQLDALTQSIFVEMFGRGNRNGLPSVPLRDAFWFQEGPGIRKWQFTSEGVKVLNVGNIERDGRLSLGKTTRHVAESEAYGKYKHFLVDAGDLVIASSGISFDADGLLRTRGAFVGPEHLPLCMNTSTVRFKPISGVSDLRYLQAWINSREFRSQITRFVTGSAQQNFGPTHLASLSITLPPLTEQRDFGTRVTQVETLHTRGVASLANLDALFSSLQHRAFSGAL